MFLCAFFVDAVVKSPVTHRPTPYWLKLTLLFLIVTLITLARSWNAFVYPILHCEDGRDMLAFYVNHPSPLSIFRFYAGYISVAPNMIGYLSTLFPMPLAPYIMGVYSLLLTSLSLTLFAFKQFRWIVRDDLTRIGICGFLSLLPLGNFIINSSVTYSLWHLLWIAIGLMSVPAPSSPMLQIVQFGILSVAIWSHPLSLIIMPVCLFWCLSRPSQRLYYAGLVLAIGLYLGIGVRSEAQYSISLSMLVNTFRYIGHRVIFEPVLGNELRRLLYAANLGNLIPICAALMVSVLSVLGVIKARTISRKTWIIAGGMAYFSIGLTFLSVMTRALPQPQAMGVWGQRYFYIQQLLFLMAFALILTRYLAWKTLHKRVKAALLLLMIVYIAALNIHNQAYFETSQESGQNVRIFLQELDRQLAYKRSGQPYSKRITLQRDGVWDIQIRLNEEGGN